MPEFTVGPILISDPRKQNDQPGDIPAPGSKPKKIKIV